MVLHTHDRIVAQSETFYQRILNIHSLRHRTKPSFRQLFLPRNKYKAHTNMCWQTNRLETNLTRKQILIKLNSNYFAFPIYN